MDHDEDCTADHSANPYTTPDREHAYREFVTELFRMCVLTVGVDLAFTVKYAQLATFSVNTAIDPNDPLPTQRALMYELARLVNHMAGGKPPVFGRSHYNCDDSDHHHGDPTPQELFGEQMMETFLTAACIGEMEQAVGVMDAAVAEATVHGMDPHAMAASLFTNSLTSIAYTNRVKMPHALVLFEP